MTAAVSNDRSNRLGTDQVESWAGVVRAARLSGTLSTMCRSSSSS